MNSANEELMKITTRVSMAAISINPKNPRTESVKLLQELNDEMEGLLNSKNEM